LETVKDFFKWKYSKDFQSIEEKHCDIAKKLKWDETDVLYSFLGVYVLGLRVMYPEKFSVTKHQIRTNVGKYSINAYSNKYVRENYQRFEKLNSLKQLKKFLECYMSVGNLIPIWPGGNVHKGTVANCFDLPEVYFNKDKNRKMTAALINTYENAFLDEVINTKNTSLDYYLNMSKEEYLSFLNDIVRVIKSREKKIYNSLLE